MRGVRLRCRSVSVNLRTYTTAVFEFEHVLRQVDGRWDAPTPCEEWSVRHVAGHTIAVVSNVAARAGVGEIVDQFGEVAAIAGDDPVAAFRHARNRFLLATDRRGALAMPVTSRVGSTDLDGYMAIMACDAVVHTWDLLMALGLPVDIEPPLLRFVRDAYRVRPEETMRGPHLYADAHPVVGDDDLAEILARAGRRPGFASAV